MYEINIKELTSQSEKIKSYAGILKKVCSSIGNDLNSIIQLLDGDELQLSDEIVKLINRYNLLVSIDVDKLNDCTKGILEWIDKTDNLEKDISSEINNLNKNALKIQSMLSDISK